MLHVSSVANKTVHKKHTKFTATNSNFKTSHFVEAVKPEVHV